MLRYIILVTAGLCVACSSTPEPAAVKEAKEVCTAFGAPKDTECLLTVYKTRRTLPLEVGR